MNQIVSPDGYNDTALILVFSPGDSIIIKAGNNEWNGQSSAISSLANVLINMDVQYFEQQECLLLHAKTTEFKFIIESEGDTQYFFAEINESNELTDQNTEEYESYLPAGEVLVSSNTNGQIEISKKTTETKAYGSHTTAPVPAVDDNNSEVIRLQALVTQLLDEKYNAIYTLVYDQSINQKSQDLYELKLEYEHIRVSRDDEKLKLTSLQEALQKIQSEKLELEGKISAITDLTQKTDSEVTTLNQELSRLQEELGIDIGVLEKYKGDSEIEKLIEDVKAMQKTIDQVLRERISARQKLCQAKHDKIAGV